MHSLKWTDDVNLSGYIFSFYNGSIFVNDSWVAMSGTANWSNVSKIVNSTAGALIKWCVYANDSSNNWNGSSCITPFQYTTTDETAPVTTAAAVTDTGASYTFDTWARTSYINVTLTCNDGSGSGCSTIQYCTDTVNTCTPSTAYSAPVQISTEGTSYIRYKSTDAVSNTETTASSTIKKDTTAPTGSHTSSGYYGNATINGTLEIIFRETLVTLGKNGYLRFPIKNLWHRCTLISVGNGSVTFSVESTPKQVTVKEGEYALVDVTDDGNADVNITVVKIYSSGATVRFSPVEQQPVATTPVTPPIVTPTVPPVTPPAQNASVVKNETTPVPSGRKLPLVWAYVILVAILGIIAFFIYSVMSRKKTEQ